MSAKETNKIVIFESKKSFWERFLLAAFFSVLPSIFFLVWALFVFPFFHPISIIWEIMILYSIILKYKENKRHIDKIIYDKVARRFTLEVSFFLKGKESINIDSREIEANLQVINIWKNKRLLIQRNKTIVLRQNYSGDWSESKMEEVASEIESITKSD